MTNQPKLRVLVIDDEVTQRMLVKEYLEAAGHSVRLSEDGKRGLKMAAATIPDIILLDLMLPSIDGYSLCKSLKASAATAEIPVILITASREADVIEKGLVAGADDFLTKPVDWAFLSDRVLNVVAKSKERAEMARLLREQSAAAPQHDVTPAVMAEFDARIEDLMQRSALQLEEVRQAGIAERVRLQAEHSEAMSRALEDVSAEYQAEFDAEIAKRDAEQEAVLIAAVQKARIDAEAEFAARKREEPGLSAAATQSLRAEFDAETAALAARHAASLQSLEDRHQLDVAAIRKAAHHKQLASESRHASEITTLRALLDEANARVSHQPQATGGEASRLHAAWSLALRTATAQSMLASAIASKTNAAAAAGPQSAEHADLDRSVRSLNNLLASYKLLAQAQAETMAGNAGHTEAPVDLRKIAADVAAQAGRLARDRGVDVRSSVDGDAAELMADESRLRYAWMCLAVNAIRFTPPGGTVELTATAGADGALRIGVADTGVGIAPNKLKALRSCLDTAGQDQTLRTGEGAGLGVPIATALTRQMGGIIEIESQLGHGTQAMMVFPAAKRIDPKFSQSEAAGQPA